MGSATFNSILSKADPGSTDITNMCLTLKFSFRIIWTTDMCLILKAGRKVEEYSTKFSLICELTMSSDILL